MVTLDDLEIDFDAAVKAMVDEALKEIAGMTEAEQQRHFLLRSIDHLHTMVRLDAPTFLVEKALKYAAKNIRHMLKKRHQPSS